MSREKKIHGIAGTQISFGQVGKQTKRRNGYKSIYGMHYHSNERKSSSKRPKAKAKLKPGKMPVVKKNSFFFGNDLSTAITKTSSIGKIQDRSGEVDILNTSAPVKISDYISHLG